MKNLIWIKEDKTYTLKNEDTTLVTVNIQPKGVTTFTIDEKQYVVIKKGFWSPVYIVQNKEEEILKLSHGFWGSEGKIVFHDGTSYTCNYNNKGGFKLRFMDGENEILYYGRTIENKKTVPIFSIGTSIIDAEKLLVLSALGIIMLQCLFNDDAASDDASLLLMIAAS